jgi:methoxymalonate biosynthesis protein
VTGTHLAARAVARAVPVVLVDVDAAALERAGRGIEAELGPGAKALLTTVADVTAAVDAAAAASADLVIEAVTERAVVKTRALTSVCGVVAPGTPLVSCSSGIPVDELADWAGRPGDVVGAHFPHPAFGSTGVELACGKRTSPEAYQAAARLVELLRYEAIPVRDAPGGLAVRLVYPLINSAARLLEDRALRPRTVDAALRGGFGHPIGPLRAADLIGIDSLVHTLEELYTRTGDARFSPCDALIELICAGRLGRKSGRGFYRYPKPEC